MKPTWHANGISAMGRIRLAAIVEPILSLIFPDIVECRPMRQLPEATNRRNRKLGVSRVEVIERTINASPLLDRRCNPTSPSTRG